MLHVIPDDGERHQTRPGPDGCWCGAGHVYVARGDGTVAPVMRHHHGTEPADVSGTGDLVDRDQYLAAIGEPASPTGPALSLRLAAEAGIPPGLLAAPDSRATSAE